LKLGELEPADEISVEVIGEAVSAKVDRITCEILPRQSQD